MFSVLDYKFQFVEKSQSDYLFDYFLVEAHRYRVVAQKRTDIFAENGFQEFGIYRHAECVRVLITVGLIVVFHNFGFYFRKYGIPIYLFFGIGFGIVPCIVPAFGRQRRRQSVQQSVHAFGYNAHRALYHGIDRTGQIYRFVLRSQHCLRQSQLFEIHQIIAVGNAAVRRHGMRTQIVVYQPFGVKIDYAVAHIDAEHYLPFRCRVAVLVVSALFAVDVESYQVFGIVFEIDIGSEIDREFSIGKGQFQNARHIIFAGVIRDVIVIVVGVYRGRYIEFLPVVRAGVRNRERIVVVFGNYVVLIASEGDVEAAVYVIIVYDVVYGHEFRSRKVTDLKREHFA